MKALKYIMEARTNIIKGSKGNIIINFMVDNFNKHVDIHKIRKAKEITYNNSLMNNK